MPASAAPRRTPASRTSRDGRVAHGSPMHLGAAPDAIRASPLHPSPTTPPTQAGGGRHSSRAPSPVTSPAVYQAFTARHASAATSAPHRIGDSHPSPSSARRHPPATTCRRGRRAGRAVPPPEATHGRGSVACTRCETHGTRHG